MVKYWTLFPLFQEKSKNVSFNLIFIIVLEVLARRQREMKSKQKAKKKNWKTFISIMRIYVENPKEATKRKSY